MKLFIIVSIIFSCNFFLPEILFSKNLETHLNENDYLFGQASWYAEFSRGIRKTTANMEKFDDDEMTCAIWDVPFNTILKVTNLKNNKTVLVRVNDRGPAKRFHGRVIDLTKAAFEQIENLDKGLTDVKVEILKT